MYFAASCVIKSIVVTDSTDSSEYGKPTLSKGHLDLMTGFENSYTVRQRETASEPDQPENLILWELDTDNSTSDCNVDDIQISLGLRRVLEWDIGSSEESDFADIKQIYDELNEELDTDQGGWYTGEGDNLEIFGPAYLYKNDGSTKWDGITFAVSEDHSPGEGNSLTYEYELRFHTAIDQSSQELHDLGQLLTFTVVTHYSDTQLCDYYVAPFTHYLNSADNDDFCSHLIENTNKEDDLQSFDVCDDYQNNLFEQIAPMLEIDSSDEYINSQEDSTDFKIETGTNSDAESLGDALSKLENEAVDGIWRAKFTIVDPSYSSVCINILIKDACSIATVQYSTSELAKTYVSATSNTGLYLSNLDGNIQPPDSTPCMSTSFDFEVVNRMVSLNWSWEQDYSSWTPYLENFIEIKPELADGSFKQHNLVVLTNVARPLEYGQVITVQITYRKGGYTSYNTAGFITYELTSQYSCAWYRDQTIENINTWLIQEGWDNKQIVRGEETQELNVGPFISNLFTAREDPLAWCSNQPFFSKIEILGITDTDGKELILADQSGLVTGEISLRQDENPYNGIDEIFPLWINANTTMMSVLVHPDMTLFGSWEFRVRLVLLPSYDAQSYVWFPLKLNIVEPATVLEVDDGLTEVIDTLRDQFMFPIEVELDKDLIIDLGSVITQFGQQGDYVDYDIVLFDVRPTSAESAMALVRGVGLVNDYLQVGPFTEDMDLATVSAILFIIDSSGTRTPILLNIAIGGAVVTFPFDKGFLPNYDDFLPGEYEDGEFLDKQDFGPGGKEDYDGEGESDPEDWPEDEEFRGPKDQYDEDEADYERTDDDFKDENEDEIDKPAPQVSAEEIFEDPEEYLDNISELEGEEIKAESIEAAYVADLFKSEAIKSLPDFRKQQIMGDLLKARLSRERAVSKVDGAVVAEAKKPEVAFEPVTNNGKFSVLFDEGLAGPDFILNLGVEVKAVGKVSTLWADHEDKATSEDIRRMLSDTTALTETGFDLGQYIDFQIRRGDTDSAQSSQLSYEVFIDGLEGDKLFFKLQFASPTQVSIGSKPDMLVATILDETFFASETNPESLKAGSQLKTELPRMLPGESFATALATTEGTADSAAQSLLASQMVMTVVLSVSLKQLWNLLNVMQVLAYSTNFTQWPALVEEVNKQVFEAIYLTKVNNMIVDLGKTKFEVAQSSTKNQYLKSQGIEDDSLIKNLGIFAVCIGFIVLIFVIYYVISLCNKRFQCCKKIKAKIHQKMFYSGPLQYVFVSYLKLFNQFASLICVALIKGTDTLGIIFPSVCVVILMIWPFWTIFHLLRNKDRLEDPVFKQKFKVIYSGIKTNSFLALCYHAVFSMRRFDIVLMNLYFTADSPLSGLESTHYLYKILIFLFFQLVYLSYVHTVHPHTDRIFNILEFVNEYSMVLLAYCMLYFTKLINARDPVTNEIMILNEDHSFYVQIIAIGVIVFMTLVNFFAMATLSGKKMVSSCKKKKLLKIAKAAEKKRLEEQKEKEKQMKAAKIATKLGLSIVEENSEEQSRDGDGNYKKFEPYRENSSMNADISSIELDDAVGSETKMRKPKAINRFNREKPAGKRKLNNLFSAKQTGLTINDYQTNYDHRNVTNYITINYDKSSGPMKKEEIAELREMNKNINIELSKPSEQ